MENSKLVDEKIKKLVDNVRYMTREDRKKLGYKRIVPQSFIADKCGTSAGHCYSAFSKSKYDDLIVIPYSIFKEVVDINSILVEESEIKRMREIDNNFLPEEPTNAGVENEHFIIEFGSFPQEKVIYGGHMIPLTPWSSLYSHIYKINSTKFGINDEYVHNFFHNFDMARFGYAKIESDYVAVQPIWWYVYPKQDMVVTTKRLFCKDECKDYWFPDSVLIKHVIPVQKRYYLKNTFMPSIIDYNTENLLAANRIDSEIDDILLKIRLLANKCPCKDKILKHTQKIIDEYNKSIDQIALDVSRESVTYEEDTNLPNLNLGVNNNASMLYTKFRIELLSLLDNINTYIDYSDEYRRLLDILKNYDKLDDDLSIDLRHFAKDILPYSPSWAEAWTNFIVSEIKKLIKIVESFNIGEFDIGIEPKTLDELITEFRFRFVTFLRSILKPPKDDNMMYERIRTEALKEARRAIANDIRDLIKNEIEPYEDDSNAICRKAANNILDQLKDHKITNPVKDFRYYNSMLFETCGVVNNIEDKKQKRLRLSNQRISTKVYEEKR